MRPRIYVLQYIYIYLFIYLYIYMCVCVCVCVCRVKQSLYRPREALRDPGVWGLQISRQSAHESGKVVNTKHRPPLPSEIIPGTHFVRGWVDPRAIVRPEALYQWKIPVTPSGIDRKNFRLIAQCLNQWYIPKNWKKISGYDEVSSKIVILIHEQTNQEAVGFIDAF
jgi:hypothetical protein